MIVININSMTKTALMTAVIFTGTMIVRIPLPGTQGYVHPGDAFIFSAGFLLGPLGGMISSGLGSMLADLAGYPLYALPTLFIKGLMGLTAGFFLRGTNRVFSVRGIAGLAVPSLIMVMGYFIAGFFLTGSWLVTAKDIPFNIMQALSGIFIFVLIKPFIAKLDK